MLPQALPRRKWLILCAVFIGSFAFLLYAFGAQLFLKSSIWLSDRNYNEPARIAANISRVLAPNNPGFHFRLGNHLKLLKEYEAALREFRRVLELDPRYSKAHLAVGRFYFLGQDLVNMEEAVEAFSNEIEISRDPYAYHLRGIIYAAKLGRLDEAEADFREEIALWSSWAAPLNLAWVLFEKGKFEEAEEAMKLVEERNPGSVFSANGLGVIYLNQGRLDEAISQLTKAFEGGKGMSVEEYRIAYPGNNPEYADEGVESIRAGIAFNLAVAYEKKKDFGRAIEWYEETLRLANGLTNYAIAKGVDAKTIEERIRFLEGKI